MKKNINININNTQFTQATQDTQRSSKLGIPLFPFFLLFFLSSALARGNEPTVEDFALPQDWYTLPENSTADLDLASDYGPFSKNTKKPPSEKGAAKTLNRIFEVNSNALESALDFDKDPGSMTPQFVGPLPSNLTPWHLEAFTTDLSFSASGLLGFLTVKGTPAVQAYWRRQGTNIKSVVQIEPSSPQMDLNLNLIDPSDAAGFQRQFEVTYNAALATGKIKDHLAFKKNFWTVAKDFQEISHNLQTIKNGPDLKWWVSGFRTDFIIEASGKVHLLASIGGDLRLRLEWKRIVQTTPKPALSADPIGSIFTNTQRTENLRKFVLALQSDLEDITTQNDNPMKDLGFQPYSLRVGLGMTAKGDIGFGKGSGTIFGHLNFSSNAKKPVIHPITPKGFILGVPDELSSYSIIENTPQERNIRFAQAQSIPTELSVLQSDAGDTPQALYRVTREKVRKGLKKAMKLGAFFAKNSSKASSAHWKLYALKTGFDVSVSADMSLIQLTGTATTEISFYNENF